MAQLNYNHLHYFWVVATLGSIVKAAQALHVTPQTISGQLRTLEERVGSRLFRKQGRRLQLTDTGQLVRSYAEPMFHLGVELVDALRAGGAKASGALRVGITPSLPRCVASRVLGAVLGVETRLVCHDAASSTLAADLAARNFDLLLSDGPIRTRDAAGVKNNLVGESDTTLLCGRRCADRYRGSTTFAQAPFILPPRRARSRRALSHWLRGQKINPVVVAEVESLDLTAALSESSGALFAAPTVVVRDLEAHYDVAAVMRIAELKEQFFVIAPGAASELGVVQAVIESAREQLRARARTPAPLEPVGTGASGAGAGSERVVNQASIRVASLAQSPRNRSRWNGVTASPVDSINAE